MHRLTELALSSGKHWQSKQTGFVHYCFHVDSNARHDYIPTYENFLFVLALLRSRTADNVNEAKRILNRLLSYQVQSTEFSSGNFPKNLHEFPDCFDRWYGVKLLAPMCWILHYFHKILGKDLLARMHYAVKELLIHCSKTLKEKPADYTTTLRIAVALKVLGEEEMAAEGEELLEMLAGAGPQPVWCSTQGMGSILTSLQMAFPSLSDSPWREFLQHVSGSWYPKTQCYCGPAYDEWEIGLDSITSLYDFYMTYHSTTLPKRCQALHPRNLEAVLVQPMEDFTSVRGGDYVYQNWRKPLPSGRGCLIPISWEGCETPSNSHPVLQGGVYSTIKQKTNPQKGFSPFRLLWGDPDQVSSLVCQGGNYSELEVSAKENCINLTFTLGALPASEQLDDCREVVFYCTRNEGLKFSVDGVPATLFRLKDKVDLRSQLGIRFAFHVEEGEGEFVGHLMPGNRPSQSLKSTQAYDWQIFLRTIRRSSPCRVRVTLEIQDAKIS